MNTMQKQEYICPQLTTQSNKDKSGQIQKKQMLFDSIYIKD